MMKQKFFDLSKEKQTDWLISILKERSGITVRTITTIIDTAYEDHDESQEVYAKRRISQYGKIRTRVNRLLKQEKIKMKFEIFSGKKLFYVDKEQ